MAFDQEVISTPPNTVPETHPRDVKNVLESLPTRRETASNKNLLDAIARDEEDLLSKMESPVFRGILTAMLWIGGASIATALAMTLFAILK
jgi:hypothetical protein